MRRLDGAVRCRLEGSPEDSMESLGRRLLSLGESEIVRARLHCAPDLTCQELVNVIDLVRRAGVSRVAVAELQ